MLFPHAATRRLGYRYVSLPLNSRCCKLPQTDEVIGQVYLLDDFGPKRNASKADPSLRFLFNRLAHPATNFAGILIHRECHMALEALRPSDDYAHIAAEGIGRNPGLVWGV